MKYESYNDFFKAAFDEVQRASEEIYNGNKNATELEAKYNKACAAADLRNPIEHNALKTIEDDLTKSKNAAKAYTLYKQAILAIVRYVSSDMLEDEFSNGEFLAKYGGTPWRYKKVAKAIQALFPDCIETYIHNETDLALHFANGEQYVGTSIGDIYLPYAGYSWSDPKVPDPEHHVERTRNYSSLDEIPSFEAIYKKCVKAPELNEAIKSIVRKAQDQVNAIEEENCLGIHCLREAIRKGAELKISR